MRKKRPTKLLNNSLKCVPMFVPAEQLFLSEISFRLEVWVTRMLPERFGNPLKCVPMFVPAELLFLSEISFRLEVWVCRVLPERFTTV